MLQVFEERFQPLERPVLAGFDRPLRDAEHLSGVRNGELLEIPEEEHIPVGLGNLQESLADPIPDFVLLDAFTGGSPAGAKLPAELLKRGAGELDLIVLFAMNRAPLALNVPPLQFPEARPGDLPEPRVERQRTLTQIVGPLPNALGERVLNDVGGIEALPQPIDQTDLDHPPQLGPVALKQRFGGAGFAFDGTMKQFVGIARCKASISSACLSVN